MTTTKVRMGRRERGCRGGVVSLDELVRKGLPTNGMPEQGPEGRGQLRRDPIFQPAALPPARLLQTALDGGLSTPGPRFLQQPDSPKWLPVSVRGRGGALFRS